MKEYRKQKIKLTVGLLIICAIFLFVNNSTYYEESTFVAMNSDNSKKLDISIIKASQDKLYEDGIYNPLYTFTGELTGYSGDCPLCTGYLACPPRTNVIKKGIYYNDKTYGKIRIVASSKNYPCGTILKFNVKKLSSEPIVAIVLDRGVGGNVIDLLTESGEYATKYVGRVKKLNFQVLRDGWK